ncbi:MAG: DUF1501 domain-containing protein [Planctomycetales bacterium]|nr:DUF1501 domain-containing protein [Planctomycetales bacterium]
MSSRISRPVTQLSRRDSLRVGTLGLLGWSCSDLFRAQSAMAEQAGRPPATADSVLFVNLAGGPSHLDTLDMKPEAPVDTRGEFTPIGTKIPGLLACEHLPKLAGMIDRFTLLRGISHSTGDHPQGQAYIATGNRPTPALRHPSYGSIVTKELPRDPELPSYVAIPQTEWGAGFMGDAYAPFKTNATPSPGKPFSVRGISLPDGLTLDKVERRQQLLQKVDRAFREADTNSTLLEALDQFSEQAYRMITSTKTRDAFDVSKESQSVQSRFGADELAQSLLLAVRLVQQGVRFVTVTNQGWDTHLDNFDGHRKLMGPLDAALPAMLETLSEKGLLERTLVVVMGEFGRTPKINENAGRDHFPRANWCLLAGGGVRAGQLIGATNKDGTGPDDATDIKPDDMGATILHALGIDHHLEYFTRTGRPVSLVPYGRVLHQVFG